VVEYDGRVRCRTIPVADQQCDEIIKFTSSVLAELALPTSSFFLTLLENYRL
jgi:hypothetical protein